VAEGEGIWEVINCCDGVGDSIVVGNTCSWDFTDAEVGARLIITDVWEYE